MNKTRTLIFSLAVISLITASLSAQVPLRISVDAAPLFNLSHVKTIQEVSENKVFVGYRIGAGIDVQVSKSLFVGSGITLAMKGDQFDFPTLGRDASAKVYSHFVQVPVNVGTRFDLTPSIGLSVEAGPFFAYALGATVSQGKILDDIKGTYNVYKDGILGVDAAKLKRFDLGLGAKVRLYLGSWYAAAGADVGFINRLKFEDGASDKYKDLQQKTLQNTSFYIGAGYTF